MVVAIYSINATPPAVPEIEITHILDMWNKDLIRTKTRICIHSAEITRDSKSCDFELNAHFTIDQGHMQYFD